MAIIGSMVAIVLHERNRVQKIEDESITIFQTQHDINTAHRYVTALVTYGESVLVWDNEDILAYRKRHMQTDSMLQVLRVQCEDFIRPTQIDSLRTLLAAKEAHLFQIMEASRKQRQTDSLLFNQKLIVITHTATKTVIRKKKGIAGLFGGKETVQLPITTRQTSLDKNLILQINRQQRVIENYTDSLRLCNKELNRKLRMLITNLDEQRKSATRRTVCIFFKTYNNLPAVCEICSTLCLTSSDWTTVRNSPKCNLAEFQQSHKRLKQSLCPLL